MGPTGGGCLSRDKGVRGLKKSQSVLGDRKVALGRTQPRGLDK